MKKLLLISLLLIFSFRNSDAQEISTGKSKNSFVEWNFGVAYIVEDDFVFPGTSVLWGSTYINENNFISRI